MWRHDVQYRSRAVGGDDQFVYADTFVWVSSVAREQRNDLMAVFIDSDLTEAGIAS